MVLLDLLVLPQGMSMNMLIMRRILSALMRDNRLIKEGKGTLFLPRKLG